MIFDLVFQKYKNSIPQIGEVELRLEVGARVCLGLYETLEIITEKHYFCNPLRQQIEIYIMDVDWNFVESFEYTWRTMPWSY